MVGLPMREQEVVESVDLHSVRDVCDGARQE